jgi:hypothetical protein
MPEQPPMTPGAFQMKDFAKIPMKADPKTPMKEFPRTVRPTISYLRQEK